MRFSRKYFICTTREQLGVITFVGYDWSYNDDELEEFMNAPRFMINGLGGREWYDQFSSMVIS